MKKYLIFIWGLSFWGCDKFCDRPALSRTREVYTGTSIKMNGIYYSNKKQNNFHQAFFFYRNGTFLDACQAPEDMIIPRKFDCSMSHEMVSASKEDRSRWGIFLVRNDSLIIETWGMINDCDFSTFTFAGKIINDTTLFIQNWDDRRTLLWDTCHFAATVKPDSTNPFIP